jgi:hypothetical protein
MMRVYTAVLTLDGKRGADNLIRLSSVFVRLSIESFANVYIHQ